MRKNAWVICCCTAVLAAFGTFFRWLQDQVCFEADTGLAVRGSIWPYAVALVIEACDDWQCETQQAIAVNETTLPQSMLFLQHYLQNADAFSLPGERVQWRWSRR